MYDLPADKLIALGERQDEQRVRQEALDFDYKNGDPVEAGFKIGHVLLLATDSPTAQPPNFHNVTNTPYEKLVEFYHSHKPYWAQMLHNWVTIYRTDFTRYPVFLYNKDYKQSRRLFTKLLTFERKPPPYHFLVCGNVFRQGLGLTHDEIAALPVSGEGFAETARHFHELYKGRVFDEWLQNKKRALRYYGGSTNTVLNYYDPIINAEGSGVEKFNRTAELRFDLGGGFNTPEMERVFGCSFISADLVSPRYSKYDPEICFQIEGPDQKRTFADQKTRDAFLQAQDKVQFQKFDVLESTFPKDAESYSIVSGGFMTSTVRPRQHQDDWKANPGMGLGHLGLSIHAMIRVIELAKTGKPVDLFTIQRATSRVFKYKTALLQWREGRLVTLQTTDDNLVEKWAPNATDWLRKKVNPDNPVFNGYLSGQ